MLTILQATQCKKNRSFRDFHFAGNGLKLPRLSLLGALGFNGSLDRFAISLGTVGLPSRHMKTVVQKDLPKIWTLALKENARTVEFRTTAVSRGQTL
jgi:hypothetical protein